MDEQLIAECEKLIFTIRQLVTSHANGNVNLAQAVIEASTCADEVEDFLVNHCGGQA